MKSIFIMMSITLMIPFSVQAKTIKLKTSTEQISFVHKLSEKPENSFGIFFHAYCAESNGFIEFCANATNGKISFWASKGFISGSIYFTGKTKNWKYTYGKSTDTHEVQGTERSGTISPTAFDDIGALETLVIISGNNRIECSTNPFQIIRDNRILESNFNRYFGDLSNYTYHPLTEDDHNIYGAYVSFDNSHFESHLNDKYGYFTMFTDDETTNWLKRYSNVDPHSSSSNSSEALLTKPEISYLIIRIVRNEEKI